MRARSHSERLSLPDPCPFFGHGFFHIWFQVLEGGPKTNRGRDFFETKSGHNRVRKTDTGTKGPDCEPARILSPRGRFSTTLLCPFSDHEFVPRFLKFVLGDRKKIQRWPKKKIASAIFLERKADTGVFAKRT